MDRTEATEDGRPTKQAAFRFVSDAADPSARSHAMREHWKQRRQRAGMRKKKAEEAQRRPLPIRPHASESSNLQSNQPPTQRFGSASSTEELQPEIQSLPKNNERCPVFNMDSVRSQALRGMNLALGTNTLDPFDQFPIRLTPQHHKLLHHWLVTYATMMFDTMSGTSFNPMREIWLPLDLSNAASFNAVMAHSAAHLARMQGKRLSEAALEFKTAAISIVNLWMIDPVLCLSDEVVAAVLRLLTYERNWGVESEWHVHHEGLLKLIELRGGIEAFQSNWRVGLPLYLISLMSSPSWFNTSNKISAISEGLPYPEPNSFINNSLTLHKLRSLWLLSLVQDIQTFVYNNLDTYRDVLANGRAVLSALRLLQAEAASASNAAPAAIPGAHEDRLDDELKRLACLFFICIASTDNDFWLSFNAVLEQSQTTWQWSVEGLHETIFYATAVSNDRGSYALQMAAVLGSLSLEARRGVEKCLLFVMWQALGGGGNNIIQGNHETPASLLASIHGE